MKNITYTKIYAFFLMTVLLSSCEEFVDLDTPNYKISSSEVFNNDDTAISAMKGIYNQLALASFCNGSNSSVTFLSGLSADNIKNIRDNKSRIEFELNEIRPDNPLNYNLWSSAYNIIYLTNSLLEGLENSDVISSEVNTRLQGEVKFVRAFTYFYLVNLYGEVPLILNTDYRLNALASRTPIEDIYQKIISDLETSVNNLTEHYQDGERYTVNKTAALALLARVHLYQNNWKVAEELSSKVIAEESMYQILDNLDNVFLANSKEAIWQISPIGGGIVSTHTNDGNVFIIHPVFSFFSTVKLDDSFVESINIEDIRLSKWIGYNSSLKSFYSYKYKIWNSSEQPIVEYSMVLRLAEQYLIRAEAKLAQGKISESIEDINVLRLRANLDPIKEPITSWEPSEVLDIIIEERRRELFAEWGHRWLDLKRRDMTGEIIGKDNPFWESTDVLYPIPAEERLRNNQLTQNPGY